MDALPEQNHERRRPTIRDVASAAGVSTATVSNVLRGTRFVGPDLQEKVRHAIATLGYRPNSLAAGLRERRSRMIGIVVPDITSGFFSAVLRRIEDLAAVGNYQILLADSQENTERETERISALARRQADGLILFPCSDNPSALDEVRESQIPTVIVDRVFRDPELDDVSADNFAAAQLGTEHLLSLGHKEILLAASDLRINNIVERVNGYKTALVAAGLGGRQQIFEAGNRSETAYKAVKRRLQEGPHPTAIFALTHVVALGALRAIWELQIRFPEELSLLAFDDVDWMTALRPFVSTLQQPIDELATEAWSTLMRRLDGNNDERRHLRFPCRLMVRESTVPCQQR